MRGQLLNNICYRVAYDAKCPNCIYQVSAFERDLFVTETQANALEWFKILAKDEWDVQNRMLKTFKLTLEEDIGFVQAIELDDGKSINETVIAPCIIKEVEEMLLWKLLIGQEVIIWNGNPPYCYDTILPDNKPCYKHIEIDAPVTLETVRTSRHRLHKVDEKTREATYLFEKYGRQ